MPAYVVYGYAFYFPRPPCLHFIAWYHAEDLHFWPSTENFTQDWHLKSLREEGRIYTCAEDGKSAFVATQDISAVAFHALVVEEAPNTDYRINGPEIMSHDELAGRLGKVLGRKIEHVRLTPEERKKYYMEQLGYPAQAADFMVWLEGMTAGGLENYRDDTVLNITGHPPMSIESFAEKHRACWD